MSHFAKVENGVVTRVIVAEQDFISSGAVGDPSLWVQTSYNTRSGVHYGADGQPDNGVALRANYAGIGFIYDAENDVFYAPKPLDHNGVPCDSWHIGNPEWVWIPPTAHPQDGKRYNWDEPTTSWVLAPGQEETSVPPSDTAVG